MICRLAAPYSSLRFYCRFYTLTSLKLLSEILPHYSGLLFEIQNKKKTTKLPERTNLSQLMFQLAITPTDISPAALVLS